ncbi:MAG: 16S rRNA (cytosine(967)-C(5))-methyltransferase RsmB [Ruminococcaceae bacterium]|mgnify:CR=1 FL=1|nr:16S rRNA (cytosine(967)-C(5))-methyltransferase RsmB [Oscillospiraceae bacterium]
MNDRKRRLVVETLMAVERGGYSNLVFDSLISDTDLSSDEVSFAAAVFYGSLERQTTSDFILDKFLKKGIDKLDPEIRAVLRSGVFQLIFSDNIPAYAAIDESVKLAKSFKKSSAASLINAVLRKVSAYDVNAHKGISDNVKRLSITCSVSLELAKMMYEQYGQRAFEILRNGFGGRKMQLRVNTLKTMPSEVVRMLTDRGFDAEESEPSGAVTVSSGRVVQTDLFSSGLIRPQSAAAQTVVKALDPKERMTVVDTCSAPGGKALTIVQEMRDTGRVFAFDSSESRLNLVKRAAEREGIRSIIPKVVDAVSPDKSLFNSADRVLCDVPCSGFGEMASKPEIRLKQPASNDLFELQFSILSESSKYLRTGGILVYSTCTLDRRENEGVVRRFLSENQNFTPLHREFFGFESCDGDFLISLPGNDNKEGFFIATLRRLW